ncbi:hypothetical protein Dsin_013568 [Dipteronia sinensis]|uniref:Uncharacterized protein n=1 Tax=Dipteronia sinensis TaxID=43782 RepID=A0AAE0AK79_9ROSI|nr:hypothetical protein Dsin_013568 [Dipteronia sinensis]
MWTINDFPTYGNLSGWSTKGEFACLICRYNTCSEWLKHSKNYTYMGHRLFLAFDHPFRTKRTWFDGQHETRGRRKLFTSEEICLEIGNIANYWGKAKKKKKIKQSNSSQLWKKKSIFFELPYWEVCYKRASVISNIL